MLRSTIYIILLLFTLPSFSQVAIPYHFDTKVDWQEIQSIELEQGVALKRMSFDGAVYKGLEILPYFKNIYPIHTSSAQLSVKLMNIISAPATQAEISLLSIKGVKNTNYVATVSLVSARKEPFASVEVLPVKWNDESQQFEKLISCQVIVEVIDIPEQSTFKSSYATSSVLATGDWFKVKIDKSGLFKVTYDELAAMGFNVSGDPRNIAVFGNGGGTLPERNTDFRYDDLVENPIVVVGEGDGSFDASDYVLFYGQGPIAWAYNGLNEKFYHKNNFYDDYAYYFITYKNQPGKRITEIDSPQGAADAQLNEFTDYAFHEVDEHNLAGSGRIWFGEQFDFNSTFSFPFEFPNVVANDFGYCEVDFGVISGVPSLFQIYINNELQKSLTMPTVSGVYQIAKERGTNFDFKPPSDQLVVKLVYQRNSNSSTGYLNYIDLNVSRKLMMAGNQMMFRKKVKEANIVQYNLSNADENINVWDITEAVNPQKVKTQFASGNISFKATNDTLREYIAFNGGSYYSAEFVEKVANQNLHSVRNIDYLIIAHPDFLEEAQRLADFHSSELDVYLTTPGKIYNEYSSGAQDITAIRDFVKMLYDESTAGKEIKYLLLFGDASYDYKHILTNTEDKNYVPCWETEVPVNSALNIVYSIAMDDYFGYLDDGEGHPGGSDDRVDIGIGRFVVSSIEQAKMAVDKSIDYATNVPQVFGSWRNMLTFIADDGDNNRHLSDAEYLNSYVKEAHPVYNIDKIYLDAYPQISTPAGQRAPEVNNAINQRIEKGTMIVNYSGHGGEVGLGHERFLELADINSWKNYDKMPIFITATCEFSRYDDPTRVSAGEQVFLNAQGGAIALFSTARATFASANVVLNMAIYKDNIFSKKNGQYPSFGDVIRISKASGGDNDKKFVLLGDPALKLAYTDYNAATLKINTKSTLEDIQDTLNALSKVRIEGEITDEDGNHVDNYNGTLFPTIYDKFTKIETLGDESSPTSFELRQSILFNGKASILNGDFLFEFIVPKDIAYRFGDGRISYYLNNDLEDGNGYYEDIVIGGYDEEADEDNEGPEIQLFMNDTTFVSGGMTDQNPVMLAKVWDESGINTTGNGIGHDILATIDGDESASFVLNEYYEADINSFNSGRISYPFKDLSDGQHTLSLKVWDIYNNSSTASIDFVVVSSQTLIAENLMSYPNPFSTTTTFVFDHNQSGEQLEVVIKIYSATGALVRTIETEIIPEGYKSNPIVWDATSDGGDIVARGFYIAHLFVRNQYGSTAQDRTKMIFIR